jgi:hypothetical protein
MTAAEVKKLGQIRVDYITKRERELGKQLTAAENELLDQILAKFISQFIEDNGKITFDGSTIKLTQALDKIINAFMGNQNMQIVRSYIGGLANIGELNYDYFKEVAGKRAADVRTGANDFMREQIGLSQNNTLVKNGFLDTFVNDPFLKSALKSYTIKAITGGMPQADFVRGLRNLIVTSNEGTGLLSRYYQTFAYDTMSQYDRAIGNQYRVRLDLRAGIYAGGLVEDSRDFCISKNNKVFTVEEMETDWPKDPDLLKTKKEKETGILIGYNPLIDLGRWRCRHTINWISKELAIKLRPDLKDYFAQAA